MKMKGLSAILVVCAVCLLVPAPSPAAVNVTAKIKPTLQKSTFRNTTATTTNTYFLKNASTATITGPFKAVIESLDNRDISLVNPDGYTRDGKPYFEYAQPSLGPSGKTAVKPWLFRHRCGKQVSAAVKPFGSTWQIVFQPTCSPLLNVSVSVFSSESGPNHTPIAEAGPDQTVKAIKAGATLDGSFSTDEDGNSLTYRWSVVSKPVGSRVTLTGATSVRPTVKFTLAGTYVLGLTVKDGALTSARDTCTLTTVNSRPVADAGPDQTVAPNSTVRLDGSGSTDADGDRLSYNWSIVAKPAGSAAVLAGATAVRPTFKSDAGGGEYVLQLVVSSGTKKSLPDFCRISTVNSPPRAVAGPDQKVSAGALVRLDAVDSSDADGDALTYRWALLSKPAGSTAAIADSSSARPSFTADLSGTYVAQLIVNDSRGESIPDTVVVTTEYSRPVANAGRDQTATVSDSVVLDGRGSSDADGGPLSWKWSLLSAPKGSLAKLSAATGATPSFTADRAGTYVVQLAVSDGVLKGFPDTVVIDTRNSRPVADAGADQESPTNRTVALDGNGSRDADDDPLTWFWKMLFRPEGSAAVLSDEAAPAPNFRADLPGTYVLQLIVGDGQLASDPDTVAVTAAIRMVTVPDVVGQPRDAAEGTIRTAGLTVGAGTSAYSDTVPADGVISQDPAAGASVAEGSSVSLVVSLGKQVFTVPDVVGLSRTAAQGAIAGVGLAVGAVTQHFHESIPAGTVITQSPVGGSIVSLGTTVSLVLSLGSVVIPPDPGGVAPPLDQTVASALVKATEFIYSGENPIQKGVEPGTIEARRLAVIRGKVTSRDGSPLPGVVIAILDHAEFGETVSRADGMFDMAVNGGGYLTIRYRKKDYLEAQRQVSVPWEDYVWAPDVALIPLDPVATVIDLTAPGTLQMAQGSLTSDERGDRRSTLLFAQGTGAQIVLPDGSTQAISSLTVRSTEYTVGENGPRAMPGLLPPGVEYTYAVELSVDEALAAGAESVKFTQPVVQYVENFLGFATGARVPVYYYDRERGIWVPSQDGRVIGILAVNSGLADVDTNGDGLVDDAARLAALGITDPERERLGSLYAAGQTLWRVASDHFSPRDINWPPPPDPPTPDPPEVENEKQRDEDCLKRRSIIECMNQTLGESIPIVGTPFTLNYRSDRVPGRKSAYTLKIPISGDTVPAKVVGIELEILVAGRKFTQSFPAAAHQSYTFTWDGLDVYGRPAQGGLPVTVRVGYKVPVCYWQCVWNETKEDWDCWETCPALPTGYRYSWSSWTGRAGVFSQLARGLGGWSLSVNHAYDAQERVLYEGSGGKRSADNVGTVISTVAGDGSSLDLAPWDSYREPDVRPANKRAVEPYGIGTGPDGSIYVAEFDWGPPTRHRVIKVLPNGDSIVVAGRAESCRFWISDVACYMWGFSGDGGLATQAQLNAPRDVAVGPDGSLYIADAGNNRIRRVDRNGIITTVVGNGSSGNAGDGGPATQASLYYPMGIAFAPDGTLYITSGPRVRQVRPWGIISTVPGTDQEFRVCGTPSCDGYSIWEPSNLAVGPDGSLYMAGPGAIRRVDPTGIISTVAGGCNYCDVAADGGPAVGSRLHPQGVAVGRDGNLYFSDYSTRWVRAVRPDGTIVTVAGGGDHNNIGDGGCPLQAYLLDPRDVDLDPAGDLLIADGWKYRVRKVGQPLSGFSLTDLAVPSADGSEVYALRGDGRHRRTVNALSGAIVYEFTYDPSGRLSGVRDGDGNLTTIERDDAGNPTAIVGPFGAKTAVAVDAHGYLASVTNPAGETTSFSYTADGLMTSMTSAKGQTYQFTYDALGVLIRDQDPAGGFQALVKSAVAGGHEVALTTATGETTTYRTETLPSGDRKMTMTSACCGTAEVVDGADGSLTSTMPDGMVATMIEGPDPRFGLQSPLIKEGTVRTPAGLVLSLAERRNVSLGSQGDPLSLLNLSETTTVNGRSYSSYYDARSRTRTDYSPAGRMAFAVSDSLGHPTSLQIDGLEPTTLTYDTRGRLSTMTMGSGEAARPFSFAYDPRGNLATVTDPLARITSYDHDAAGRLIAKTLPDGRVVSLAYDANGNLTSITPPGRPAHGFSFNAIDLREQYAPPPLGAGAWSTSYAYDLERRLTAINRPDGATVSLTYAPGGKLQTIGTPEGSYSYAYHATSKHVQSISAPGGVGLAFAYDGNLLLSQTWTGEVGGSVERIFDNDFRVVSRSVNGGNAIAFGYDSDSLLVQAGSLEIARSYQNQLITGATLGGVTDTRGYNSLGEPATYEAAYSASPLISFGYVRDKLGRIVEKTETAGGVTDVYTYGYDVPGRLTTVTKNLLPFESYAYDGNGNRVNATTQSGTVTGTYDDQDRLLSYGSATYAYSANGDLVAKTDGGQTTTYDYDALGNLRGVTLPGGTQIVYVIDGLNRRIGKKVNGALVQGFLYDNLLHPIAELSGSGDVVSRFVYGTRGNAPDYLVKGGATYRIISDHLGSPRRVVDVSNGTVVQEIAYDGFGNILSDSAPGFQPFGFAGGLYDQHTKLTRFGARDYDAQTGRWTAKDPIRFSGRDTNLYGYALGDPVNLVDHNGMQGAPGAGPVVPTEGTSAQYETQDTVLETAEGVHKSVETATIAGEVVSEAAASATATEIATTAAIAVAEGLVIGATIYALDELVVESSRELLEYLEWMEAKEERWWELDQEVLKLLNELQRMFPCHKRKRK